MKEQILGTGIYNISNHTNFILEIPDNGKTKAFRANIQGTDLPDITNPATRMVIKEMGISDGNLPSANIEYGPFTTRILLDEEFTAYTDIYQWMISNANPNPGSNTLYDANAELPYSMLHILNNTKDKIVLTFVFDGLFPESISGLEMNYTENGHVLTTVNVSFQFKRLWIERDGVVIAPNTYTDIK